MYRSMLNVSFGVFDFLDVYVKLGVADYKFKADLIDQFWFPFGRCYIKFEMGFCLWRRVERCLYALKMVQ